MITSLSPHSAVLVIHSEISATSVQRRQTGPAWMNPKMTHQIRSFEKFDFQRLFSAQKLSCDNLPNKEMLIMETEMINRNQNNIRKIHKMSQDSLYTCMLISIKRGFIVLW